MKAILHGGRGYPNAKTTLLHFAVIDDRTPQMRRSKSPLAELGHIARLQLTFSGRAAAKLLQRLHRVRKEVLVEIPDERVKILGGFYEMQVFLAVKPRRLETSIEFWPIADYLGDLP